MTWKAAALILGAACAVTATIAVRHLREQPPPPEPPVRLSLEPPPDAEFGSVVEDALDAAIAPDGRQIVFAAVSRGVVQLWRRNLDAERAEPLAGTERAMLPVWSSDGASILFFADRKLKRLKLADGATLALAEAPDPAGAAALADDSIVFAPAASGPLKRLHAGVLSDVTRLQPGDVAHSFPARVPDTAAFVYLATREDGRRVLRLAREAGDVDLTRTDSQGVVASGYVLHLRESTLVAKRFDLEAQRLADPTVTLAFDVGSHGGRGFFAAGERLLAWQTSGRRPCELRWFDLEGHDMSPVGEPADYWQVRLSPDERHAAVTMVDPLLRTPFVFTMPIATGWPTRLSRAISADSDPVWSEDGRQVAFRSLQEGQPHVFARKVDAAGSADELLVRTPLDEVPSDRRDSWIVFHAPGAATALDIWRAKSGAQPAALVRSAFNEVDGRVSPDGRWLAYASDESGHYDVYINRMPERSSDGPSGRQVRVSTAGGTKPQWGGDGRAILFLRGSDLMRASVRESGGELAVETPARLFTLRNLRDFFVSRTGSRILAIAPVAGSGGALAEVFVNWTSVKGGIVAGSQGSPRR